MVADFLTVRREYAPLIDLALGERAQRFLVRDGEGLAKFLAELQKPFSGRVSFLPLKPRQADGAPGLVPRDAGRGNENGVNENGVDGLSHPGLIARADQVVTCEEASLAHLPGQLLGQTLIVRDVPAARSIAAQAS